MRNCSSQIFDLAGIFIKLQCKANSHNEPTRVMTLFIHVQNKKENPLHDHPGVFTKIVRL